jgi:hypothetical protein
MPGGCAGGAGAAAGCGGGAGGPKYDATCSCDGAGAAAEDCGALAQYASTRACSSGLRGTAIACLLLRAHGARHVVHVVDLVLEADLTDPGPLWRFGNVAQLFG